MSEPAVRLLLLRHGEVDSHRGDVPITAGGADFARGVGRNLASRAPRGIRLLSGATLRTRQTAEAIADGAESEGATVRGPFVNFALRNPDLYVAGERVDMVSSFEALAEQVPPLDAAAASAVPFFQGFIGAPDRIGWWLSHTAPPGDSAAAVAARIRYFAASLVDLGDDAPLIVGVTHSPVLRAIALAEFGEDSGEPAWVAGISAEITSERSVHFAALTVAP